MGAHAPNVSGVGSETPADQRGAIMADRITREDLAGMVETLQIELRAAGIIDAADTVVLSKGYGGWLFYVQPAGTTVQVTGRAGMLHYHAPAREALYNVRAVIGALFSARYAAERRAAGEVSTHRAYGIAAPAPVITAEDGEL